MPQIDNKTTFGQIDVVGEHRTSLPVQRCAIPYTIAEAARQITHCACGGLGYIRIGVPLDHPLFGKAVPCVCQRDERAAIVAKRMREMCGLTDEILQRFKLEKFNVSRVHPESERPAVQDVLERCYEFARDPRGWLVLVGPYGTGKTHLAYGIVSELLKNGIGVFASTAPDMLQVLRQGFGEEGEYEKRLKTFREVAVLVIDDLATERGTDWAIEQLYSVINHRYEANMPMVVTTNVHPEDSQGRIEPRIASRLMDWGLSDVRVLKLEDYRRKR